MQHFSLLYLFFYVPTAHQTNKVRCSKNLFAQVSQAMDFFVFIAQTFTRNFGNVGTRFRNRHKFIVLKYFANKTSHYEYSVIFLFYATFGKTQGTS